MISDPKNVAVLIVDDVPATRQVLVRMLRSQGYTQISEAGSVAEGLKAALAEKFLLIVTDVHLRDGSAIDLITQFKAAKGDSYSKFLVITSDMDMTTFSKVSKLGVMCYLVKPFNSSSFRDAVNECLAKRS